LFSPQKHELSSRGDPPDQRAPVDCCRPRQVSRRGGIRRMLVGPASLAKATNTQVVTAETTIHQRQMDRTQNGYICYKYTELLLDDYYRSLAEHTHSSQTAARS
uniref:Uncharacterized protein n=1 Tax=Sander lucioperca TaxID=283035 RepID=A0A8D0CWF5_SANLU